MLRIFRTNNPVNVLLLVVYALLLYGSMYFADADRLVVSGLSSALWQQVIPAEIPALLSGLFTVALLLFQALLFNSLVVRFKIVYPVNYLAALFYILTAVSLGAVFSPALVGLTFVLLAFYRLVNSYEEANADPQLLDAGLYVGLASILYIPYAVFLIFAWVMALYLRAPSARELLIVFSGFTAVYIVSFTIAYVWGDVFYFFVEHFRLGNEFGPDFNAEVFLNNALRYIIPVIVGFGGVVYMQTRLSRSLIQVRKYYFLTLLMFFFGMIAAVLMEDPLLSGMVALAVPLAFFVTYVIHYSGWKKSWEAVHILWLGLILWLQWVPVAFAG